MLPSTILAGLLAAAQVPEPPAPAADITWRAPASCPGRASLVRGIQTRLGRPLRAGELGIDGTVSVHPTAPRYRLGLRLRVGGRDELRTLGAETCSALADATAVLVALAVEASPPLPARPRLTDPTVPVDVQPPIVTVPEPPELPTPPIETPVEAISPDPPIIEPTPEPPTSEPAPAPPPPVAAPPRRRPGGFVRLHGGPELGAVPGVTGLVGLATGVLWRRARLEFQGLYLAPRTASHPLGDVRASLAAGAVHGCARPGRGRLEVPLCGGLELGSMRGTVDGGSTVRNWWLGAVLGAGVTFHVHRRVALWSALQMVGSVIKPNFFAKDPGPEESLFRPEHVTGRLLLGVEIKFSDPR